MMPEVAIAEATGSLPAGLARYMASARPGIECALVPHLPATCAKETSAFDAALRYAVFPGGKRLRPVLTMLGAEVVGGDARRVASAAAAMEYVHTSSLIFDDLPCMDDARERRGRMSLHLRLGEGLAVLVALALLNASYGMVSGCEGIEESHSRLALAEMVECIGASGMIGGQVIDIAGRSPSHEERLRNLKTSALVRLALRLGAILSGAGASQLEALTHYANRLGEAYQMRDDLLDLAEDGALAERFRPETFALKPGRVEVKRQAASLAEDAGRIVRSKFGASPAAKVLCELATYAAERES